MTSFAPEDFPILMSTMLTQVRRERELRDAIGTLSESIEGHTGMRKVVHDELKYIFSRAVDNAWKEKIADVFVNAGKYESLPADVLEVYWMISTSSLHDILSAKKKVDKAKACGPMVDAMREFINEVHPLAQAMASLKASLVKGRAPPTAEQIAKKQAEENPDKIVKTCSCCFRPIAMAGFTMAHHGYQRPGDGEQTASCEGIGFRPLEVSSDGLKWILGIEKTRLEVSQRAYDRRDAVSVLRTRKSGKVVDITKDDASWDRVWRSYVGNLESEIRFGTRTVSLLQEKLDAWVQTEDEGLRSVQKSKAAKP